MDLFVPNDKFEVEKCCPSFPYGLHSTPRLPEYARKSTYDSLIRVSVSIKTGKSGEKT